MSATPSLMSTIYDLIIELYTNIREILHIFFQDIEKINIFSAAEMQHIKNVIWTDRSP